MASTTFVSGTTIASAWLNDINTAVYKAAFGTPGTSTRTALTKFAETISVKDFGAAGDFDPSTGLGTDDRAAIQAAFDYAISVNGGCKVIFPAGRYYGGSAAGAKTGGVAITLGTTSAASATNVVVEGYGATLYQGAAGRFLGIFGAANVRLRGLKMFGYAGGTLGATRQNDAVITINYYSKDVYLEDMYITNGLGDQVYVGGSLVSGGELGYESRNVHITKSVIKTRYGNGTSSFTGGTQSRTAVACVDCVGLFIYNNQVLGNIDLEPNLDGQHVQDEHIFDNSFRGGHVTPQAVVGTAYWFDEPIGLSGGSTLSHNITMTGVPGSPVVSNNTCTDNYFEDGYISDYNVYAFDVIGRNTFQKGQIIIGSTTGTNDTSGRSIIANKFLAPRTGETCAIRLNGFLIGSVIANNEAAGASFTYLINNPAGGSTGDGGRLSIANNYLRAGTAVNNLTLVLSSTEYGSINQSDTVGLAKYTGANIKSLLSPMQTISFAGVTQTINWQTYGGNVWYLSQANAAATSLTMISNAPGDGYIITLISGANGGGSSTTIIHGGGTIQLKGAANAVMAGNQTITLISRAGIWFELSRGF